MCEEIILGALGVLLQFVALGNGWGSTQGQCKVRRPVHVVIGKEELPI